jgi:polar amino acid transport system permease protein
MSWDWDYAWRVVPALLEGFKVTVIATLLGSAIAIVAGLALAVARRSRRRVVSLPTGGFVEAIRSTPLLIQLYVLFYVLPDFGITWSGLVLGIIGLGLHYGTYTSEVYRAGLESIPRGQWDAAEALGLRARPLWLGVILPQAIPAVLPALGNYVIAMFKDSALLSAITVVELLGAAKNEGAASFRYLEPFILAGCLYLAVSYASARLVRTLEHRLGRA